jgi:hypothetical protein
MNGSGPWYDLHIMITAGSGNQLAARHRPSIGRQRPPLHHRCLLPLAALLLALSTGGTAFAQASQPVQVFIADGLLTQSPFTAPADAATKYVTIENVRATNPSNKDYQRYSYRDFQLIAFDRRHRKLTFTPVVRPNQKSLDFHWDALAMPHEQISVTVTFQVPNEVTEANLIFVPSWQSDGAGLVDFVYFSNNKVF